jgi:hypothetical protein
MVCVWVGVCGCVGGGGGKVTYNPADSGRCGNIGVCSWPLSVCSCVFYCSDLVCHGAAEQIGRLQVLQERLPAWQEGGSQV